MRCGRDLEEDEYLEVVRMSFQKALKMVYSGEIADSKTMLSLLLAKNGFDNNSV